MRIILVELKWCAEDIQLLIKLIFCIYNVYSLILSIYIVNCCWREKGSECFKKFGAIYNVYKAATINILNFIKIIYCNHIA